MPNKIEYRTKTLESGLEVPVTVSTMVVLVCSMISGDEAQVWVSKSHRYFQTLVLEYENGDAVNPALFGKLLPPFIQRKVISARVHVIND